MCRNICFTGWFLLLCLPAQAVPAEAVEVELKRIHWEKQIAGQTRLVVSNQYGDVRLRSVEKDDDLVLHAVAQDSKLHQASVDFAETDDKIVATVNFVNAEKMSDKHRLDLAIMLPKGLDLEIEIEKGDLSSKKLYNNIKARSQFANLSLKSTGSMDLFTKNGDIDCHAVPAKANRQHQLKTHKGDIDFYYLANDRPFVRVTAGRETTSNSVKLLESRQREQRTNLFGNQEQAKQQVSIQSDTGSVRLIEYKNLNLKRGKITQ